MKQTLSHRPLFLGAVFTLVGLVTNPQVVSFSLNSQQVNVEEKRRERERYDTPTLNQEKPSEGLDEKRPIERIGAWVR